MHETLLTARPLSERRRIVVNTSRPRPQNRTGVYLLNTIS